MDSKTVKPYKSFSSFTRRDFLYRAAAVGGTGLLLNTMNAWGMGIASTASAPPALSGSGKGKKVLILGAGLAGMTAAYELEKLGYKVQILEARAFAGGRCQTARKGFSLTELGGEKQTCASTRATTSTTAHGASRCTTSRRCTTPSCSKCRWR
jgi:monoamine oxidase